MKLMLVSIIAIIVTACATNEISLDEKKAELYYAHGTEKLIAQDYTSALDNLLKAKELKTDSKIYNNLGMAYYFKEQQELAISHLKKSIDLDNKNSDAKNNLASIYLHQKKYSEALKLYQEVLNDLVYQEQYRTHYNIALAYLALNKYQKGTKHLALAIKEKPDYCAAHHKLGEIAKASGHYVEAYEKFREASLGVCYNYPAPIYEQGMTLIMLNKIEQAKEKFNIVVERFSNTPYATSALKELDKIENSPKSNTSSIIESNLYNSTYKAPTF